jgi:mRNA-degrading endonuclease YafQ of YafQ-DinJ toxin-antitoxin module
MNFEVEVTSYFKKQAKRLLKKHSSLKGEIEILITELNPKLIMSVYLN